MVSDPAPALPSHVRPLSRSAARKLKLLGALEPVQSQKQRQVEDALERARQYEADPDNWLMAGAVCAAALVRVTAAISRSEPERP